MFLDKTCLDSCLRRNYMGGLKFDYLVNISKNSFFSANSLSGGFSEKPQLKQDLFQKKEIWSNTIKYEDQEI